MYDGKSGLKKDAPDARESKEHPGRFLVAGSVIFL